MGRLLAFMLGLLCSLSAQAEEKGEWKVLFNGKDFTGWVIDGPKDYKDKADGNRVKPLWTVNEGMIRTSGAGFGFLRYDEKFDDFLLHVEYRLAKEKGANSGIGIRTKVFDSKDSTNSRPSFFSYEVQLLDDADKKPDAHSTGSLYRYIAPTKSAHRPAPEWNTVEIECRGPKIRVNFNGMDTLQFDQSTDDKLKSKPLSGYICLQTHSKPVEFRVVKIKPLTK
jgi:hypothetical protein